jgi:hypothetical protein
VIRGGVIWGGEIMGGVINFTLIQIQGSKHFCSLDFFGTDKIKLNIGCQSHSFAFWKENFKEIGKKENYTDDEISEYERYINIFSKKYGKV